MISTLTVDDLDFEAWCRLGFAVVDASPESLAVQVYTLDAPETELTECLPHAEHRRAEQMRAQRTRAETTLGSAVPGAAHDLRCVRYAYAEGHWAREPACVFFGP